MRVVSKFRDYYDSVQGHGQDQTTTFIRSPEIFPITELNQYPQLKKGLVLPDEDYIKYRPDIVWKIDTKKIKTSTYCSIEVLKPGVIAFCGKLYRYQAIRGGYFDDNSIVPKEKKLYFYSPESLSEFLDSHGKLVQDIYRRKFSDGLKQTSNLLAFLSRQGTNEAEDDLVKARIVTLQWAHIPDTFDDYAWIKNGCLSDVEFYKAKDPYTAFQELDMYISGVLGQQAKEVINISDKDRIHQHGFDSYSFRKMPEESKKKQKK